MPYLKVYVREDQDHVYPYYIREKSFYWRVDLKDSQISLHGPFVNPGVLREETLEMTDEATERLLELAQTKQVVITDWIVEQESWRDRMNPVELQIKDWSEQVPPGHMSLTAVANQMMERVRRLSKRPQFLISKEDSVYQPKLKQFLLANPYAYRWSKCDSKWYINRESAKHLIATYCFRGETGHIAEIIERDDLGRIDEAS